MGNLGCLAEQTEHSGLLNSSHGRFLNEVPDGPVGGHPFCGERERGFNISKEK